ncbi:PDR/VanB family oxidoreductase [Caulobacter sp. 602-1]|uniref:PDR/VanB family oxidoreductase n=1 Tax=Caulobacter sp. 602-1 TaxID=2492472 RepID=UPI000F63B4A5|nr:PDR/VanB family oxidoreductase [Caulobacter sp. 602-1]RRN63812.1 oxidoreductase [Caulobacter sp. 602-1]
MSDTVLNLKVARRVEHPGDIVAVDLVAEDGAALPAFTAGAHVDLHVAPGLVRQYSLLGDPAVPDRYRLAILLDPASRGGSRAAHRLLTPGAYVKVGAPRNHFPLAEAATRSVLVGGGIGITPMLAMAHALARRGDAFELRYCTRSAARTAFLDELAKAPFANQVRVHHDDAEPAQRFSPAQDLPSPAAGLHLYVCGPAGFMDWVIEQARALGYPEGAIHREYFSAEVDTSGGAFEVVAARSGKTLRVGEGVSIVAALAAQGVDIEVSCEEGVCGTCLVNVLEGEVDHRDVYLTDAEKAAHDQMLVCCSRAKSARLVLDV